MKFAVSVNGKKFPVQVMKEPNSTSALSNFKLDGRTYRGLPSQYNGLRYDKGKGIYTAISVVVTANPIQVEKVAIIPEPKEIVIEVIDVVVNNLPPEATFRVEVEETPLINPCAEIELGSDVCGLREEETTAEEPELSDEEEELQERKTEFLHNLELESQKLEQETKVKVNLIVPCSGIKKINFRPRWSSLFPESESFGEGLFDKHKHIWVKLHGSDHLKMAHDMQCRCDSLYIQERANKEFPHWAINDLLIFYEIDSPDFGILTFLKNFKHIHRDTLNLFKNKVLLGTTDENPDEESPIVVISDYLGHADLSIPLIDLVNQYGDRC